MQVLEFVLLSAVSAAYTHYKRTPCWKVIELLDSLATKIIKEGASEEKAFKEFSDWCTETDLSDVTIIREMEAADFTETELAGIIDDLGRAINILDRAMAKNPEAFEQADTKNRAGLIQSEGALVDAARRVHQKKKP